MTTAHDDTAQTWRDLADQLTPNRSHGLSDSNSSA